MMSLINDRLPKEYIMYRKNSDTRIAKMLHKRREFEESNPRYRIEKAIQNLHKLEKYYVDAEYRPHISRYSFF
jgi:hypothetical protein